MLAAVASMTASLQQLAVTPTASPSPPATKAPKTTAGPPAKARRSASGRRQPPPQQDRSDRKRRTRQPKASDAPTSSSRPLSSSRGNASSSRSGRGRVSMRLLRQVPREQPPQVNTPQLPRSTPDGFTHYSIDSHPWARYVNPRPVRMLRDRTPRVISELDRDSYRQLPDSGYMSLGFNRSLFPQTTLREDRPPAEITFIELPHLEDAVLFREQSKRVIDDLLAGTYQDVEVAEMDPTPLGNNPSTIVPPLMDGCHPVLYQVVATGRGASVVLEAKDFFVVGPDRSDLHCIILDQYAIEVLSGGRGYDKSLVSVKDFVWVYKVKPTPQALQSPTTTLQQASLPRTSALETTSIFFFRASHFAFVTPRDRREPIYGIILSLTVRHYKVAHARAAFEGCPEAVTLTPSVCHFNLNSLRQFDIVSGISRVNVPTAMRFSEPPVSLDARSQLAAIVRKFFPMHPEEGILPLTVSKIPASDRRWLADRLGAFDNFQRDPAGSKQKVAKIINAACSALAAVNSAGD
ncbi:hypothetical protein GCK32_019208, partial [Trichostrongylus colubriformis]